MSYEKGGFMDEIKGFFIDNSSQLWTLFSVIIGGLITYVSTSATEKRKNKRQAQKEKLEEILVPYCTCLEETALTINTVYAIPHNLYSQSAFLEWLNKIKKPISYLEAAKRLYLSKNTRGKLQSYKTAIEVFEQILENESTNCLIKYKHYISAKLEAFPNVPRSMLITFSMNKATESKTKISILNKQDFSLLWDFTCIDFVENDEPENYGHIPIKISEDIRNTREAINYGVMDISDVENSDIELSCILLDFIDENIKKEEIKVLNEIIDETRSAENLIKIVELLNSMTEDLIKEIDKITN